MTTPKVSVSAVAARMILGPISLLDCAAFVFFLIPQLLFQAGPTASLLCVVRVLPFLGIGIHNPMSVSTRMLTDYLSISAPFPIHQRALLHPKGSAISVRPECHHIPGHSDTLRKIRFCLHSRTYRTSLLLEMGSVSVSTLSYAAPWLLEVPDSLR